MNEIEINLWVISTERNKGSTPPLHAWELNNILLNAI